MTTQKHLGTKALVGFIAFMNMFVPLSIDLYLPAMPEMGSHFQAGSLLVGMTLTAFFLMFALSIVFFGPLSDKYGRRKILISSTVLYIAASLICAAAPNVYVLIAGRILEAIGAGAIITVATALIKECFTGQSMTKILAVTQALGVIAPMAAPYMAYLAVSSFVYVSYFGLTAQEYSYYFAVNSAAAIIGPGLYLWLKKSFANRQIIIISFVTASISGLLVLLAGSMAAITFLLSFLPFTIIESMVRPFSMDILLREVKENVGTAAAMINFMHTLLGSIGMALGTLPWPNFIQGLAIIMLVSLGLGILIWKITPQNDQLTGKSYN
jgi:MFS family permease